MPTMALDDDKSSKQSGHRPVTSCTFCRQHKIKCNASDNYPSPCQRCERMGLKCEIDPQFRPKKGSQIQSLKSDVDELKAKIELLTKNELLLTQALNQHNLNFQQQHTPRARSTTSSANNTPTLTQSPMLPPLLTYDVNLFANAGNANTFALSPTSSQFNDTQLGGPSVGAPPVLQEGSDNSPAVEEQYPPMAEFVLGNVTLPREKADELHERFVTKHLPHLPILTSRLANELYHRLQLLFWAVMLTASLSEPEPQLYMSLALLIKQLAIETCWIKTPRLTHVIQALIILSIWPLPNEKVLDDCLYRFVGLAKNLALQLGLHRGGEFIKEFSRTQVHLGPDSDKWRTRSWLAVFFCEQFWLSVLGLPPSINTTDYLLENARIDQRLPKNFRCLISLSIFQCKLINVMGILVTRPDGLLEPSNRAGSLNILDRELDRLRFKLKIEDALGIEVYFLYIKLMICCFAFLPGTPIEDQVKYVSLAYLCATRIITIILQMLKHSLLIELPIYVRQGMTYLALILFKLHLSRYLLDKYVDSSRQSIVTVHRLLRNTLSSWKDLKNDILRTAKVLENLNIVLYTYPDILVNDMHDEGEDGNEGSIILRMRSHLTASLFYDLVWCVHEARRRTLLDKEEGKPPVAHNAQQRNADGSRKPMPLPFYNQITKDDFNTITTTTSNGTTITTLVPTDQALSQARQDAALSNKPLEINGIPLTMLEATGSMSDIQAGAGNDVKNTGNDSKTRSGSDTRNTETRAPEGTLTTEGDVKAGAIGDIRTLRVKKEDDFALESLPGTPPTGQTVGVPGATPTFSQGMQPMFGENMTMQEQLLFENSAGIQLPLQMSVDMYQQTDRPEGAVANQIDNFFQQQSNGWLNNNNYQDDDFLGWFDVKMASEK